MIKVSIPAVVTRNMTGIGKTSQKPYNLEFQTVYVHTIGKDGKAAPFPEKLEIILDRNEQGHPMLINAAIVRLAGQHFHVRKLGNSRFATIYEWDGVSRTLLYKNSFSKKPWRRSKGAEKVYRSSSLHTKQKRSVPTVIFGIVLAMVLMGVLGPTVYARLHERFNPKPVEVAKVREAEVVAGAPVKPGVGPDTPLPAPPSGAPAPPKFAGCARIRQRCQCFDEAGTPVVKEALFCEDMTRVAVGIGDPLKLLRDEGAEHRERLARMEWADNDRNVLAYMQERQTARIRESMQPAPAKVR